MTDSIRGDVARESLRSKSNRPLWLGQVLYDRSVSRDPACLCYANGRFYMQDQGSMHGTYVNGQRMEAVALDEGDRIKIEGVEFLFRVG